MEFIYNEVSTINNFIESCSVGMNFCDTLLLGDLYLSHEGKTSRESSTGNNSGRYKEGSGFRAWQHNPIKRATYLGAKKYMPDDASRKIVNSFREKVSDHSKEVETGKTYCKKHYESPSFGEFTVNDMRKAMNDKKTKDEFMKTFFNDKKEENTESSTSKESSKSIWDRTEKGGKDKPNISVPERIAKDAQSAVNDLVRGANTALEGMKKRDKRLNKNRAEGLSDEELRSRINRLELERRYNSLTSNDTNTGYDRTMRVLNTFGSIASVGSNVVSIIAGIKNLENRKR